MPHLHPLLRRQIGRHLPDGLRDDQRLLSFVEAVNGAYSRADVDRTLLERSLDLSSQELLQANADMRQSVSVLRATLESTMEGILVVDTDGRMRTSNRRFAEIWGLPTAIIEGGDDHRAIEFVLDQVVDPQQFVARIQSLYEDSEAESIDEIQLKDGRILERYSQPQRIGGVSVGRVWSFRDVTARRQAEQSLRDSEERLRQAQKMEAVGLLAGGIAHDFNNLLTAIGGYAALLLDGMDSGHPWRSDVEEIRKASDSAASLTQRLLAFSRRQILAPKILDLNEVVSRTDVLLRRLIGEDILLVTQLAERLHPVNVDPGQIEQVLMNLAVNARDAMPRGGRLTVETANVELDEASVQTHTGLRPGRYVLLTIGDTGTGMDDTVLPHIFEPFYTTKKVGEGTGLGLATVYGIVKQSGGIITVESAAGRGTMFRIHLPASLQNTEQPQAPTPARARGGSETILLAEDQEEVRSVTRNVLTRNGYVVLSASNGEQAVRILTDHSGPIDLLLTDVVMPVMGGRELAAHIHETRPAIPVLFASGYTDDAVMRGGILEAGVHFLPKPFSPAGLLAKVREVLDLPSSARRAIPGRGASSTP